MSEGITQNHVIAVLFTTHARLSELLIWLFFAVIHVAVAVTLLFCAWAWKVQPEDVSAFLRTIAQTGPVQLLGGLGVTVATLLLMYTKGYRLFARVLMKRFALSPIAELGKME